MTQVGPVPAHFIDSPETGLMGFWVDHAACDRTTVSEVDVVPSVLLRSRCKAPPDECSSRKVGSAGLSGYALDLTIR